MQNEIQSNSNISDNIYYSLNRIIGLGYFNDFSISINKINGITSYITGPFITFYDIKKDKAISFYTNKNNRAFSCISYSDNGNYLACAEGFCTKSDIFILDISNILKGTFACLYNILIPK